MRALRVNRSIAQADQDNQLACSAQAGCLASFELLVFRYQTRMLNFLIHHTDSLERAEDVLQETWLRAYQSLNTYNSNWQFSTWIFTIARRLAQRNIPPKHLRLENDDPLANESHQSDVVDELDWRNHLWQEIRRYTSDDEFEALWLHYVEQIPIAEISQTLGKSHAATKMMLSRTRKRLSRCIASFVNSHHNEPPLCRRA